MWTKFFFERFWEGEQRNEIFVCMPFHHEFDGRFTDVYFPGMEDVRFLYKHKLREHGIEIDDKHHERN